MGKVRINLLTNKNEKAMVVTEKLGEELWEEISTLCKNKYKFKLKTVTDVHGAPFEEVEILNDITLLVSDTTRMADVSEKLKQNQPNDKAKVRVIGEEFSTSGVFASLEKLAQNEGVIDILALPDLSEAIPCPVGTCIRTKGKIYPSWIGTDIGCGVSLFKISNAVAKRIGFGKVDRLVKRIKVQYTDKWDVSLARAFRKQAFGEDVVLETFNLCEFDSELGSIGQGNHFCEIQKKQQNNEEEEEYYICVHSGSRSFGVAINKQFGYETTQQTQIETFLKMQQVGIEWAKLNRVAIANRVMELLLNESDGKENNLELVVDICHNFVCVEEDCYVHRKGAIPSNKGPVMIPGSRGTHSYLVNGNPGVINSLPHGAGRKCSKTDAGHRYQKQKVEEDTVICNDKTMLSQEFPGAYKDIDSIIGYLTENGMVEVLGVFSPVLTLKYTGLSL